MAELANYRPHYVTREDRADGTILLRSGYELSEFVEKTSDWLHRWAELRPDTVFMAERDGAGWREVTYANALAEVRAIAGGLLARGLGPDTPILVISGNGVDHGLLALAAQYVGIPIVPVAEQYSLIPGAHAQLRHVLGLIDPRMVFARGSPMRWPWRKWRAACWSPAATPARGRPPLPTCAATQWAWMTLPPRLAPIRLPRS